MSKKTLVSLLIRAIEDYDINDEILFTKQGEKYIPLTRGELISKVLILKEYLDSINLKKGDKVAIISENRPEWILTDLCCLISGFITVPVYTSLSPESVKYILKDSGTAVCFVSTALQLEKVISVRNELPDLKFIVFFNDLERIYNDDKLIPLNSILGNMKIQPLGLLKEIINKAGENINEEDLVTIIYTSGTTGTPKGVMLTHKNIYSNLESCRKVLQFDESDVFLSYLPYSHIFERVAGYYLSFFSGSKIYYAQSIDTIAAQMKEVRPTFVISVPRLLDKMYNRLMKSSEEMPDGFSRKIFFWGLDVAKKHGKNKKSIKWIIADKLVFSKVRARTGGRMKYFLSGGGALNINVGKLFDGMGIETLEGYGMTEASPVISVNRPWKNKYGTVGLPLEGVEVKIAGDGEILVRGDLVMKGYYNAENDTRETLIDGWLHTGDIGEFDSDRYLKITDRKKSLFKSSGGKYIAPAHIEELIAQLPYIDQICVIGNERMYVTALIVPEMTELKIFAKKNNISFRHDNELISNPQMIELIEKDIKRVQNHLATYEKVRKFKLLSRPFSIETGELTPTLKIKRKVVEERYISIIEEMYPKV